MKNKLHVIVGNIGTVYSGNNAQEAKRIFNEYKEQSQNNYGRAAGESVTLMCEGEISQEYRGTNED